MKLITVDDNNVVTIEESMLLIGEFKELWLRDKSRKKTRALGELAYIHLFSHYMSPYSGYNEKERLSVLSEDLFPEEKWKPDSVVGGAMAKYRELNVTYSMHFLEAARAAGHEVMRFLKTVNLGDTDKGGKPLHKPSDITKALADSGKVMESIKKWEEAVKQEQDMLSGDIRGGGEAGAFEDAGDASWLLEEYLAQKKEAGIKDIDYGE